MNHHLTSLCHSAKLHALAASARIANVPSVVSNVWLGCALVAAATRNGDDWNFLGKAAMLGAAGVSLYLAGNFLNDWADRDWDAVHRPERALPREVFPASAYLIVAGCCGVLGMGAAAAVNRWCLVVALLIGLCIVLYTRTHKRTVWAVIPMGLCRALLPVLGIAGFLFPCKCWGWVMVGPVACAGGPFCHIVGLSLSARNESLAAPSAGAMRFAALLFPIAAASVFAVSWVVSEISLRLCLLGLLPYGLWITLCLTVFRRPVSRQVANLLAGLPLVDWIVLLPLALALGVNDRPIPLPILCLLLPPLAVLAGKLLQKIVPAT